MKFYTSVEQAGNRLLVRGYNNGDRYSVRVPFNPTLFLPTKKYSEWKTLEGEWVEPHKFGSCLLYTSPSPRDVEESRMPSSA